MKVNFRCFNRKDATPGTRVRKRPPLARGAESIVKPLCHPLALPALLAYTCMVKLNHRGWRPSVAWPRVSPHNLLTPNHYDKLVLDSLAVRSIARGPWLGKKGGELPRWLLPYPPNLKQKPGVLRQRLASRPLLLDRLNRFKARSGCVT